MLRVTVARAGVAACLLGTGTWLWLSQQRFKLPPVHSALQPGVSLRCELKHIERLSASTSRFRFALPTSKHVLGLPTCSHVLAVDDAMVSRAYTPVTLDALDKGYFDLVVKRYENGYFSEKIHRLQLGDSMDFRGPVTTLLYHPSVADCLGMVAGGTGITPMYQLIRTVLSNPNDATRLTLLYANRTEDDILLRHELDALAERHPGRFEVHYLVEERASVVRDEKVGIPPVSVGRVAAADIQRCMPPPTVPRGAILVCGPEGMMDYLCGRADKRSAKEGQRPALGGLLRHLGYGPQVVQFRDYD